MSLKSLLSTLPEDLENIVHKYNHQLNMKNVMDELMTKSRYCFECDMNKASLNNNTCRDCHEHMCDYCQGEVSRNSYFHGDDDTCLECQELAFQMAERDEDETSSQIAYAEEELWREMHGVPSMMMGSGW